MANMITDALACARYNLRARDAALLETVTGLNLPSIIGETRDGVAMLGSDEWLALLTEGTKLPMGEGQPVSIVDVSDRSVGIIVEGLHAIDILSAGCPLDLARWPVGRASRTIFELVEVVIIREADTRFRVEVWRSFAPWLREALKTASNALTA